MAVITRQGLSWKMNVRCSWSHVISKVKTGINLVNTMRWYCPIPQKNQVTVCAFVSMHYAVYVFLTMLHFIISYMMLTTLHTYTNIFNKDRERVKRETNNSMDVNYTHNITEFPSRLYAVWVFTYVCLEHYRNNFHQALVAFLNLFLSTQFIHRSVLLFRTIIKKKNIHLPGQTRWEKA